MRTFSQPEWTVIAKYSPWWSLGGAGGHLVLRVRFDVETAEALAYSKFPADEIHNGRGDALKHCYLSALLCSHISKDFAKDLMDAHEDIPGNPPAEEFMDKFNNAVGRHIAKLNPKASDGQLGELCLRAVISGETRVLTGPGKSTPSP
jgi:hypothetical protein